MIPLRQMHMACDAAPRKAQTLEQHLKRYHGGKMPKGDCKFLKQYKAEHPDEFAAAKGEADVESASKGKADAESPEAKRDAAYLKAVADGDTATCAKMVLDAAKAAMPKTTVTDADGNPRVMFHGTETDFNAFDPKLVQSTNWGKGFYFISREDEAKGYGSKVKRVFLNCLSTLDLSTSEGDKEYNRWYGKRNSPYDSYKVTTTYDGEKTMIVCRKPDQIKSADPVTYDDAGKPIPLSKRFDFSTTDLRY